MCLTTAAAAAAAAAVGDTRRKRTHAHTRTEVEISICSTSKESRPRTGCRRKDLADSCCPRTCRLERESTLVRSNRALKNRHVPLCLCVWNTTKPLLLVHHRRIYHGFQQNLPSSPGQEKSVLRMPSLDIDQPSMVRRSKTRSQE